VFAIAFDLTVKETTKHHLKGVSVLLPVASREAMATARRKATTLVLCSAAAMERCGNEGLSQQLYSCAIYCIGAVREDPAR
jgi:hypothetical protein